MDQRYFEGHIERLGESVGQILAALDGVDPRTASICMQMLNTMQLMGKHHAALLSQTGVPAAQAGGLLFIGIFEGISQRELSEKLGIASSSSSVMLQRMEKAGLVVRKGDDADQRVLHVFLTDVGRQRFLDVKRAFEHYMNSILGGMSEQGMQAMTTVLDEFSRIINTTPT